MSQGIRVYDPVTKKVIYDSSKPRLQIAVDRDPAHLDITYVQGTALATVNNSNPQTLTETLFRIKHNLGYTPKCFVYFYYTVTNSYSMGVFYYGLGGATDSLAYQVDDNEFRIVHILDDPLGAGVTSTAPSFGLIKVKYLIFSNPVNNYTDPTKR